ncbi:MAG TPA: carbohydrate binding domain-containing protein, partial [Candidatus Brocadiia bacterium]|nr:carbohydrate binding domain-containing protein [Candidatus Brocadiia bacterium]
MRCVLLLAAVCALAAAAAGANLAADSGFESFRKDVFQHWQTPKGWPGKLSVVTAKGEAHSGRACAQLEATEEKGEWKGRMMSASAVPVVQGARYRFAVWAKGQGELVLGCVEYGEREGKKVYNYSGKDQATLLTAEWKQVSVVYFQEEPAATRCVPYIEVRGKDAKVMVDDAVFEAEAAPGYAMIVAPRHTMAAQGSEAKYDFVVKSPKEAGAAKVLVTGKTPDGKSIQGAAPVGPDGKAVFALPLAEDAALGVYELRFVLEKGGVAEAAWLDVVDPATYATFAKVAAGIKMATPARLVFV